MEVALTQYYFTGASLPLLQYESKSSSITEEDFINILGSELSLKDRMQVLSFSFDIGYPTDTLSNLGQKFWTSEKNLRNELVRLRTAEKSIDARNYLKDPENDPYIIGIANTTFKAESPYEAETIINNWRWTLLCELETGHFYDVDFFTAYYLKLQILNRKNRFSVDEGIKIFNSIYQTVLKGNVEQTGEMQ